MGARVCVCTLGPQQQQQSSCGIKSLLFEAVVAYVYRPKDDPALNLNERLHVILSGFCFFGASYVWPGGIGERERSEKNKNIYSEEPLIMFV